MSGEVNFFAEVREMDDLHAAARCRAEQLNVSRQTIDAAAGLADGYAAKLLAPKPLKHFGALSLGLTLRALGLKLLVVDDPEATAATSALRTSRNASQVRPGSGVQNVNQAEHLLKVLRAEMGRRAVSRINSSRTPAERSACAKRAAQARWRKSQEPALA